MILKQKKKKKSLAQKCRHALDTREKVNLTIIYCNKLEFLEK